MNPQDYILEKLSRLKTPNPQVASFASQDELVESLVKIILSKKFRKYSVSEDFTTHLRHALALNIEHNEPIKFVWPFGGYKLWRLEEAPEVDWAELFSLMYVSNWIKPVAEHYKPGVWFDFSSDDVIVERLNNIPKTDTESYAKSFLSLVDFLKPFIPDNVSFTFTPVGSRYTDQEFESELKEKLAEIQKANNDGWPEVSEKQKQTIDLNIKLRPRQDEDSLWREKNKALHDAYAAVSKRRPYFKAEDKIVVNPTPYPGSIGIGTTKTSVAKFWVGVGVLKHRKDGFIESILSPEQLNSAKYELQPISIEGLNGKNFNKIRIVQ